jgi:hypothetical protein
MRHVQNRSHLPSQHFHDFRGFELLVCLHSKVQQHSREDNPGGALGQGGLSLTNTEGDDPIFAVIVKAHVPFGKIDCASKHSCPYDYLFASVSLCEEWKWGTFYYLWPSHANPASQTLNNRKCRALTTFTLRAAGADGAGENIPHGRLPPGQHAAGGGGRPGRCNLPQNRRLRHSECIQGEKLRSRLSRSCSLRKRLPLVGFILMLG